MGTVTWEGTVMFVYRGKGEEEKRSFGGKKSISFDEGLTPPNHQLFQICCRD